MDRNGVGIFLQRVCETRQPVVDRRKCVATPVAQSASARHGVAHGFVGPAGVVAEDRDLERSGAGAEFCAVCARPTGTADFVGSNARHAPGPAGAGEFYGPDAGYVATAFLRVRSGVDPGTEACGSD